MTPRTRKDGVGAIAPTMGSGYRSVLALAVTKQEHP